jgi:hypothetical protein
MLVGPKFESLLRTGSSTLIVIEEALRDRRKKPNRDLGKVNHLTRNSKKKKDFCFLGNRN